MQRKTERQETKNKNLKINDVDFFWSILSLFFASHISSLFHILEYEVESFCGGLWKKNAFTILQMFPSPRKHMGRNLIAAHPKGLGCGLRPTPHGSNNEQRGSTAMAAKCHLCGTSTDAHIYAMI